MNSLLDRISSATAQADDARQIDGAGRIMLGVFDTFARAGIPYCVLHGYDNYPQRIRSDVDCIVSRELQPRQLVNLLHENRARIGAEVVRWRDYYVVLAGKNADGSPCFLKLDLNVDYELGGRMFYAGNEVLENRRKHDDFFVPSARIEFGCYLIKKITKGRLHDEHSERLGDLYQQDPAGCDAQIARFWGTASTALIISAARSGAWAPVRNSLGPLCIDLRRRALLRNPWHAMAAWMSRMAGRVKQVFRPDDGLEVVILGPDGAGKSSVTRAVHSDLESAFTRTSCCRFPPSLLSRLFRRPEPPPEKDPHGSEPRPYLHSVIRAVFYWFVYYGPGYFLTTRVALARGTLVVHDRHLVDSLVDPIRYGYGGPPWLTRLIWRLIPKPDLVILLDAAPEVLQARKQEVPFSETARQLEAYRSLLRTMQYGHAVDVARPLNEIVRDVDGIILEQQSARIARRLGLKQNL